MGVDTHQTMTEDVTEKKVMIETEEIIQQTISSNNHNNHNKSLIKTAMNLTTKITTTTTEIKTINKIRSWTIKTNLLNHPITRIVQYNNMIKIGIKEDIVLKCNLRGLVSEETHAGILMISAHPT